MNADLLKGILHSLLFCLVQVLVLNHIHLFGIATPLLYVYFILQFQRNSPRWLIVLWAFLMGLVIDIFENTPGVTAFSLTLLGVLQPIFLSPFIPRDSSEDLHPSIHTLGVAQYCYYVGLSILFYNIVFFTVEMFNFFNWQLWAECVGGSSLLTFVLLLVLENLRSRL